MNTPLHKFFQDAEERGALTGERYCQAMFNHLHEVRPDLAEAIRGSDKDPYYSVGPQTSEWTRFVAYLQENWYLPTE